jgi:hypothetical protein
VTNGESCDQRCVLRVLLDEVHALEQLDGLTRLRRRNLRLQTLGDPLHRAVEVLGHHQLADHWVVPRRIVFVAVLDQRLQLLDALGADQFLIIKILVLVLLGLVEEDQGAEILGLGPVELQALGELLDAVLGQVPASFHDQLEDVGGGETGEPGEDPIEKPYFSLED